MGFRLQLINEHCRDDHIFELGVVCARLKLKLYRLKTDDIFGASLFPLVKSTT
jgi:hypothetical protein